MTKQSTARIFIIVGNESSGKDEIIRAIKDLGALHAEAISKYTSRDPKNYDGPEMICQCQFVKSVDNLSYEVVKKDGSKEICDIVYLRNGNQYGFNSKNIWQGLKRRMFQVIVVSEVEAINKLREIFGGLIVLVYVHSHNSHGNYAELSIFVDNFDKFDHVLIYEDKKEDLFDQVFRLFRAYESGLLN